MRTKTLLLTAALTAAGIGYTMAQTVYSVNVVGYVNVTVPAQGYALLANPLSGTNNNLNTIIPVAPDGASILMWDPATQGFNPDVPVFNSFLGRWEDPNGNAPNIPPGQGFFLQNPETTPLTITFVGEVLTGNLTNTVYPRYNLLANKVPQQIGLQAAGLQATDGDRVLFWDSRPAAQGGQQYKPDVPVYVEFSNVWDPFEPTPAVGEGFFYFSEASASKDWVRNFTIN